MNKRWPYRKSKHAGKKRSGRRLRFGLEPVEIHREEVRRVGNDDKNVLVSKTAWVFVILLVVAALKVLGLADLELGDSEAEGLALGIVAIIGIVLRLVSHGRVHILPVNRR